MRFRSVLLAPVDHVLGGLAAADAHVGELLFLEGDAPGLNAAGLLLDLVLAGAVAALHGFDKAGVVLGDVQELLVGGGGEGFLLQVLQGPLVHGVLQVGEALLHGGLQLV